MHNNKLGNKFASQLPWAAVRAEYITRKGKSFVVNNISEPEFKHSELISELLLRNPTSASALPKPEIVKKENTGNL